MDDRASQGGKARAARLTPAQRSAAARHAVQQRWRQPRRPLVTMAWAVDGGRAQGTAHSITRVYGTAATAGGRLTANTDPWIAIPPPSGADTYAQ